MLPWEEDRVSAGARGHISVAPPIHALDLLGQVLTQLRVTRGTRNPSGA